MKRWLILMLLACLGGGMKAQSPVIRVNCPELSSGRYSGSRIEVSYTAPSSITVSAYVNGILQPSVAEKAGRSNVRSVWLSGLPEAEYEKCAVKLEFKDRNGRVVEVKQYDLHYEDIRKNLYMLSIGVGGQLSDRAYVPLIFPRRDATSVRDCFRDYTKSYYREKEFRLQCDPGETTTQALRVKLEQMARDIQEGDVFMLYLSGHGELKDGEFYFVTYDTRQADLPRTALSGADIRKCLHQMAGKGADVFVFLDACHAEALYKNNEHPGDRVAYFASCQADQKSTESLQWKNSAYAMALIAAMEGVEGLVKQGNGEITVAALQDYLTLQVRAKTNYTQTPVCYHPAFRATDVVFKAPARQKTAFSNPSNPSVPESAKQEAGDTPPTPGLSAAAAFQEALKCQRNKELVKAFQLMKSAAEQGYKEAYRPLADMYHGGRGVQKDRNKAEYWYQKAVDAGDKEAWRILINM